MDWSRILRLYDYRMTKKIKLEFTYEDFAKSIIKNSGVKLFMVENNNQLAKYLKQNIYGKKIFLDTENTVTIYQKLSQIYQDISILESVIGGDNKGRYSIIFFNIYENIKVFITFIINISR